MIYGHASDYTKTTLTPWQQIGTGRMERTDLLILRVRRFLARLAGREPAFVTVGRHSYGIIPGRTVIGAAADCPVSVGLFCSIAAGVVILAKANHPTDLPSTYPFQSLLFNGSRGIFNEDAIGRPVTIGHDVWIGQNAIIMPGVTIGTGAVIGAGSVVTKDVPDYVIVAGNPARVLRPRFDDATGRHLLASRWWDLPDKTLFVLRRELYSRDIGAFLDAVERIRMTQICGIR